MRGKERGRRERKERKGKEGGTGQPPIKTRLRACIHHITWSEHVTNSEIRRRIGQPLLSDIIRARRLKLFGHVARAEKSQDHSRALRACIWHSPKNWKRRLGRPRHTWLRTLEADLRPFNLGLASGFKKAQDRTTWHALTGTVRSPTSPE